MSVTVVIPAHNEADRVGPIVAAAVAAAVGPVVVYADSCTDNTAAVAAGEGAEVVEVGLRTKGAVMALAADQADTTTVLYLDADTLGLQADQVRYLAYAPPAGGMLVGVRGTVNDGRLPSVLAAWPSISGERRAPTDFIRGLHLHGSGWEAETMMIAGTVRQGLPHRQVILAGVSNTRPKGFTTWASEAVRVAGTTIAYAPELARYAWTMEP